MTTIALSNREAHRAQARHAKELSLPQANWKMLYFICIACLGILLCFYVFFINELIKGSYLIKSYRNQIAKLSQEHKALSSEFAEAGFLGSVQEKAKAVSFQKVSQVRYIEIVESSLAQAPLRTQAR